MVSMNESRMTCKSSILTTVEFLYFWYRPDQNLFAYYERLVYLSVWLVAEIKDMVRAGFEPAALLKCLELPDRL